MSRYKALPHETMYIIDTKYHYHHIKYIRKPQWTMGITWIQWCRLCRK